LAGSHVRRRRGRGRSGGPARADAGSGGDRLAARAAGRDLPDRGSVAAGAAAGLGAGPRAEAVARVPGAAGRGLPPVQLAGHFVAGESAGDVLAAAEVRVDDAGLAVGVDDQVAGTRRRGARIGGGAELDVG